SAARHPLSVCFSPLTYLPAYAPFKPNKSGQRSHPPYYRGCWHGVSRCLFNGYRQNRTHPAYSSPSKAVYNPEGRLPARGMAGSDFHPLPNIPYCCLPEESGPCLSARVGEKPLSSPTDRRLGRPLPYQLANQTHAHPSPINLQQYHHAVPLLHAVLIHVSMGCPPVMGRLHTRYAPLRRFHTR